MFGIGYGKGKSCALEEAAHVAHIGRRENAGRNAARRLCLSRHERLAQFDKRIAAEKRAKKQSIGAQRAADLHKDAGQIIDEVQGEDRCCKVSSRL